MMKKIFLIKCISHPEEKIEYFDSTYQVSMKYGCNPSLPYCILHRDEGRCNKTFLVGDKVYTAEWVDGEVPQGETIIKPRKIQEKHTHCPTCNKSILTKNFTVHIKSKSHLKNIQ
jgi:hypothetical protein